MKRRGKVVYEVPEPEPFLELDERETEVLRVLHEEGCCGPDRLIPFGEPFGPTAMVLAKLEVTKPPLILKTWGGYKLAPAGLRHAEELGL